ncbi:MAG: uL30 family ribosomal protein [Candidatus ainarchaeum sp.]|nr:uL30 family ribosomal protein [Candidatus ainarchaeum sp.]
MYAIIRIRGQISISPKIKKTLSMLNLHTVNSMSIWPEDKKSLKMLKVVENHATFGTISEDMIKEVITKRGKAIEGKLEIQNAIDGFLSGKKMKEVNLKNQFRLSPPRKGFDRKGIKKPFTLGGALGNRKDNINELIKKMI